MHIEGKIHISLMLKQMVSMHNVLSIYKLECFRGLLSGPSSFCYFCQSLYFCTYFTDNLSTLN